MFRRDLTLAAALMVALAPSAATQNTSSTSTSAQSPASASAQTPIFRSGIDVVAIDATVVDGGGRPIEGLTAEHFELQVDGRSRAVISAQYVTIAPATRSVDVDVPAAAHFTTNENVSSGRVILFAVDQEHIRPAEGKAALRAAAQFIDGLHPADRIAVTGLPRLGPTLDFTTNHRAVREELQQLVGQATPVPVYFNIGVSEALSISEGTRQDLDSVVRRECGTSLAETESPARAAEPGGLRDPCPIQVEQESRALAQYVRNQTQTSLAALRIVIEGLKAIDEPKTIILVSEGLIAEPRYFDFAQLSAAAAAARATIHVLQLEVPTLPDASQERPSPTVLRDRWLREEGLSRLAGAGRGGLFSFVGDGSVPFGRIARELSGYYLLGFQAADEDRDGRVHRIDVRLRRQGATIRAREAFVFTPHPTRADAVQQRLADLLRSRRLATELPLRVATYSYQEPGTAKLRVVVSAETASAADPASVATLSFVLLDASNVVAASAMHVASEGRYSFSAVVPPGDYTLRVAGIDGLGRRGTVERAFGARLVQAGRLRVSDLMIATDPGGAAAALQPTVDRTGDRQLVAYLELYADELLPLRQATVRVEVAESEGGPTFLTIPATLQRRDARWSIARALLPIDALPSGRYFARAHIFVGGEPVKRLVRPFSVERTPRMAVK